MAKFGLIVSFVCFSFILFAQPEDAKIEEKDGKKYYVHFVQDGNTLWAIHKMYNVPIDVLVANNPGVENGVVEGQKIMIPFDKTTSQANNSGKKYVVQPQETLYGISKKFGVTTDALIEANPGIENGIKVGQELILPDGAKEIVSQSDPMKENVKNSAGKEFNIVFSDTIIQHTVLSHETMYSISKRFMVPVEDIQKLNGLKNNKIKAGDVIKIPVRKEKFQEVNIREIKPLDVKKVDSTLLFRKKDEYNVALLLPFFLDKQDAANKSKTEAATEFYMGAKIAMDSLEKMGVKATFYVYDSKNDTNSLKAILAKKEFAAMDMIIGPFFPDKMNYVAEWCKKNKVKMICPVPANTAIIKNNPNVFTSVPSDLTLMEGAAKYILSSGIKDQIVLVKPVNPKEQGLYDMFRQSFLNLPTKGVRPKLIEVAVTDVKTYIKKGTNTFFIVPTNDKTTALKFMNAVNANVSANSTAVISIMGTREWLNFDEINEEYKNRYNFQFPSPNDFNYSYENTKNLMKIYRRDYNADMSKIAAQGFDVVMYYVSKYLVGGIPPKGVLSNIEMYQKGVGNGFENGTVYILKQQDYEIIKIYESAE